MDGSWVQFGDLAVIGSMALGALLYIAGFREGRRDAATKPTTPTAPEIGWLE